MAKKQNIITDWLLKYGSIEIEKQVDKEIEYINISIILEKQIKKYCKEMNIKLYKFTKTGFIGLFKKPIKAGMEYTPHNGKIISLPIKTIGYKSIYREFLCYKNGDIVDNGIIKI